jgi:Reverse transcriptase (RNA-dependent DNA polymerase)
MSEAYEQIRVDPAHVYKTAFATILGTFRSEVMQMGDCNAPSTFQRLMTTIFCDCIGRFVHVYMDDIFISSGLIEEHEKHLGIVFDRLRKNHLFLSKKKVDLYSEEWSASVISLMTKEYTLTLIKCSGYESGGLPGCTMTSRGSSASYNI